MSSASAQVKRKAVSQVDQTNPDHSKPDNKKQRNTSTDPFTPQFIDFGSDNTELLLPRGQVDPFQPQLFTAEQKIASKKATSRQANKDDLFSSKKTMGDDDNGSDEEEDLKPHPDQLKKSKHDMTKSQVKTVVNDGLVVKNSLHLTSSVVQPGQIFLATVANITPFELKVTLPDGISGAISYREISDTLTAMIDIQLEAHMEDPSQVNVSALRDLDILANVPTLDQLFTIGQQITPMIIKVVNKPHSKTMKQKIFCSLRPSIVNAQYAQSLSLLPSCGVPLMGDIESVEAKGYVVNYSLPFKGFVPFTEKINADSYPKGALVTTLLPKDRQIGSEDRTIQVSLDPTKILHQAIAEKAEITFEQIRAGQFYHGMVSKHLPDGGLVVQILGDFFVSVSSLHLPPMAQNSNFPILTKVLVRVLATQQNRAGESKISGTLHRDLVSPQSLYSNNINFTTIAQLGDIKRVKIVKTVSSKALMVQFLHDSTGEQIPFEFYSYSDAKKDTTPPILGWLPLRSCADVALTDFPKQFKVGATIAVRVVGFNYLDCLIQLTAKPSLLQAQALAYSDMIPGQKYNGIVIKTLPTLAKDDKKKKEAVQHGKKERSTTINNGVILQISPTITAFIPLSQLSNQGAPSNPALLTKKYALGSKHSCLILVSEPDQKKLIATSKPALLDRYGKDEAFGSYSHAKDVFQLYQSRQQPLLLGGYVDRCTENFVVVRFFNNIVGVITKTMLVQQGIITATQNPEFVVGEYLLTRVLNVYDDKLSLSLAINVSREEQDKLTKLTETPATATTTPPAGAVVTKAVPKKTPFELATRPGFLLNNLRITGQNKDKDAITLQFTLADQDYDAVLHQSQLSDHVKYQALMLKKLSNPQVGSGDYLTLPVAMVMGCDRDEKNTVQLSLKMSNFIMYADASVLPTSDIPQLFVAAAKASKKEVNLLAFLQTLAEKVQQSSTTKPLPIPFANSVGPYVGTVQSMSDDGNSVKVAVSNAFGAYIYKTKLFDSIGRDNASTLIPAETVTIGQSLLFSQSPSTGGSTTQYQSKLADIAKITGPSGTGLDFILRWITYMKSSAQLEAQYLKADDYYQIDQTVVYPIGFELGAVLSNAKIAKFEENAVHFTTPASTKQKVVLKCTDVDFHAPQITEATIGTSMDIVVVGYNEEIVQTEVKKGKKALSTPPETQKVVYISTMASLKSKSVVPESIVGHAVTATVVNKGPQLTISVPSLQNALLTVFQSAQPNTTNFVPFCNNLAVGSQISVLVSAPNQAVFIGVGKFAAPAGKLIKKTFQPLQFAQNTVFDSSIKSTADLSSDATLDVKVDGLYKDGKKIDQQEFGQIEDLRRYEVRCIYGNDTPASVSVTIPLSALSDPLVSEQTKKTATIKKGSKKTTDAVVLTNILDTLTQLIAKKTAPMIKSKIVAVQPSTKSLAVHVSIRESDLDTQGYKTRGDINSYKNPDQSIHNAVVLKVSPIVGLIAQLTSNIQVHIQPDACAVGTVEKVSSKGEKKQRIQQLDFALIQKAVKVGDIITFRVLSPENITSSTSLLDGALLHADLNPQGVSAAKVPKAALAAQQKLPTIPRAVIVKQGGAYNVGDVINGAKIVKFNDKASLYQLSLPNGTFGEISLVELVEPHVLAKMDHESCPLGEIYKPNDVISQIIVLSARVSGNNTSYICSTRVQRRSALLSGDIVEASAAQSVVGELQNYAKSAKSIIALSTYVTQPSAMSDASSVSLPVIEGLTVDALTISTFIPGQLLAGIITNIAPQGLFVQVSATQSGQVTYSDLTDHFTDAKAIAKSGLYQIGQPIIVSVKNVEQSEQKLSLIAKPSVANLQDAILLNALKPGSIIAGSVKQVNSTGVWVLIKPSNTLTGLSHSTNCVDDKKIDYQSYYKQGDKVKAVVLKVDADTKKIEIGLKGSLFSKIDKIKAKNGIVDDDESTAAFMAAESSDEEDCDRNDEEKIVLTQQQKQLNISANREQSILSSLFSPLGDVSVAEKKVAKKTKKVQADEDEELVDFSILDSQSVTTPLSTRLAATVKATTSKDAAERKIELLEHALAGINDDNSLLSALHDGSNTSDNEFELRCAAQPNSAAVWISYMAFKLQNNEIQKARDLCSRGLKIITVSAIEQRWVLYSSLLSIEVLYGTVTSLDSAMGQTLKEFEKVKVYSEIGRIAISSQKYPLAIEYYNKALRSTGLAQDAESNTLKSRQILIGAQETYISLISLLFAQQKRTEAQSLLKTAMKQLPPAFTSLVIIKTILLEYQSDHGSVDNGRIMFQMFLKDHPKRIDVWMTWLQQEIKLCKQLFKLVKDGANTATGNKNQTNFKQQKTRIRELFDIFTTKSTNVYGITWSTLKPAQVKLIYSLAIDFENSPVCQGDSRTDTIKNRAQIYVEEVSN